jgi:hypothetical protein
VNINVTQVPPQQITVQQQGSVVNVQSVSDFIQVNGYLPQQLIFIQPDEPDVKFGLWVQTGLGDDGTDFEVWIGEGLSWQS